MEVGRRQSAGTARVTLGQYQMVFSIGSSWKRRKETVAVFLFSMQFGIVVFVGTTLLTLFLLSLMRTAAFMAGYLFCMYIWSKANTSGRRRPWMRDYVFPGRHFCDFFPITLVKTAPLPPDGTYLLGVHPHGIISQGAFGALCTEGARLLDLTVDPESGGAARAGGAAAAGGKELRGWKNLFPGLDRRLATLQLNFRFPFLREYLLDLGLQDAARESFRSNLKRGRAFAVVVGGADETFCTQNHNMQIILKKRKGFVREAMLAGASLVPVASFGESNLYSMAAFPDGHFIKRLQVRLLRSIGFVIPVFSGRGVFNRDFGFMPRREPVCVVVGSPIPVPAVDAKTFSPKWDPATAEPANDAARMVDEVHARYTEALTALVDKYSRAEWNTPGRLMLAHGGALQIVK